MKVVFMEEKGFDLFEQQYLSQTSCCEEDPSIDLYEQQQMYNKSNTLRDYEDQIFNELNNQIDQINLNQFRQDQSSHKIKKLNKKKTH